MVDGVAVTGWFTEDFTLAELKTLRAKERLPQVRQRNTLYNGLFEVPDLRGGAGPARAAVAASCAATIGVYPETKHPTYFRSIGPAAGGAAGRRAAPARARPRRRAGVHAVLRGHQPARRCATRSRCGPLVFLTSASGAPYDFRPGDPRTYADLTTPAGLAELAHVRATASARTRTRSSRATGRRHAGHADRRWSRTRTRPACVVHPYTFRAENQFLPADYRSAPTRPIRADRRADHVPADRDRRVVHRSGRHRRSGAGPRVNRWPPPGERPRSPVFPTGPPDCHGDCFRWWCNTRVGPPRLWYPGISGRSPRFGRLRNSRPNRPRRRSCGAAHRSPADRMLVPPGVTVLERPPVGLPRSQDAANGRARPAVAR